MAPWAAASRGDPTGEFLKDSEGAKPSSRAPFLNHNFWHAQRDVTNVSNPLLECPARVASRGPRVLSYKGLGPARVASRASPDTVLLGVRHKAS